LVSVNLTNNSAPCDSMVHEALDAIPKPAREGKKRDAAEKLSKRDDFACTGDCGLKGDTDSCKDAIDRRQMVYDGKIATLPIIAGWMSSHNPSLVAVKNPDENRLMLLVSGYVADATKGKQKDKTTLEKEARDKPLEMSAEIIKWYLIFNE
jgi:hypothetical protein